MFESNTKHGQLKSGSSVERDGPFSVWSRGKRDYNLLLVDVSDFFSLLNWCSAGSFPRQWTIIQKEAWHCLTSLSARQHICKGFVGSSRLVPPLSLYAPSFAILSSCVPAQALCANA